MIQLFALAIVLLFARVASAQVACPSTGTAYSQSYAWKVGGDAASDALPYAATDGSGYRHYDNRESQKRYVIANSKVTTIGLNFGYSYSEYGYDFLSGQTSAGTGIGAFSKSGTYGSSFTETLTPGAFESFQTNPLILSFTSDYSVNARGFNLTGGQMSCSGLTFSGTALLPFNQRADLLLRDYNDKVYFRIAGTSDSTLDYSIALWNETYGENNGPGNEDADVYVDCGTLPTTSSLGSARSGNLEYIHWTASTLPCSGNDYYVMVHLYKSAYQTGNTTHYAHLLASQHKSSQHLSVLAAMNSTDTTVRNNIKTLLRQTGSSMYAASGGQTHLDFDLYYVSSWAGAPFCYNSSCGGSPCRTCITVPSSGEDCGGGAVYNQDMALGYCPSQITAGASKWRFVHELGHYLFKLNDAYEGKTNLLSTGSWNTADPSSLYSLYNGCGHSMMANSFLQPVFCTDRTHFWNAKAVRTGGSVAGETDPLRPGYSGDVLFNEYLDGIFNVNVTGSTLTTSDPVHATDFETRQNGTAAKSDWGVAIDIGKWIRQPPQGSPDPYDFHHFEAATTPLSGYPGVVTTHY